jgi:putative SOS response-associated peptidase YedK
MPATPERIWRAIRDAPGRARGAARIDRSATLVPAIIAGAPAIGGAERPRLVVVRAIARNVASTDPVPVVRYDAKDHQRSFEVMRWGLVPFWAKDIKVGFANINAKAEGIENKPAFREAFRQRRCLVPVDNFCEWKKVDGGKQPYAIGLKGGRLMCTQLHNRMPVVLAPDAWPQWLGEEPADVPHLEALLAPYPADEMICWPVSPRIGNVKNNDPSLVEPINLP